MTTTVYCNSWSNEYVTAMLDALMTSTDNGRLEKIDETWFLDQTDYLIGKLPDQTEVQIRTLIRLDFKT